MKKTSYLPSARLLGAAWAALLGLTMATSAAHGAANERFTEDKLVTIYVSLPPGGSYDSYARVLSRHIGKHLPGQPSSVIIKNMPGGGGVTLANYLYNIAPKDGTHFGIFESGVPFAPILKDVPAKYDPQQFWLAWQSGESRSHGNCAQGCGRSRRQLICSAKS